MLLNCSLLLSFASLVLSAAVPSKLEARAGPYQTRIYESGSTFLEEDNGWWQLIDATGDGRPDLFYIKNRNTGTGYVEVHIASSTSNYQTRILEVPTTFVSEDNGTWRAIKSANSVLPDLVYIKTRNTPSGNVEVHIASGASTYKTRTLEVVTTFGNEDDGQWNVYDYDGDGKPDLVFIKTSNTGTATNELFVASGSSNYQTRLISTGTTFSVEDNGFWQLGAYSSTRDLIYIKNRNTGTGTVEVHVASAASGYKSRLLDVGSTFVQETNGPWALVDWNKDGVLDLVYIKIKNTGTGTVEVHVATGKS
ncbi:FG-GAP repeat protein [Rutstroemia sp. NJR-2017a BBW]|nr:FG-GAP repeat protein [Rutstroemia sp. NJR-2017a BBW]